MNLLLTYGILKELFQNSVKSLNIESCEPLFPIIFRAWLSWLVWSSFFWDRVQPWAEPNTRGVETCKQNKIPLVLHFIKFCFLISMGYSLYWYLNFINTNLILPSVFVDALVSLGNFLIYLKNRHYNLLSRIGKTEPGGQSISSTDDSLTLKLN